ncbi:MAG: alpha/beta hydrolase [Solobacterium sp.]|nr:alpha/beta hydrolase [Solobacterium sp.]
MRIIEYGKQHNDVIMLLHGGGLSWWNYRAEAELLSNQYHVVLPILDGHGDSENDFISIEENAKRIISYIDKAYGGSVLLIGGLSLGAQVLVEMLGERRDICKYAIIESASVIPTKLTNALLGPSIASSYSLIQKKWFAKMQFRYLRIREDLFEDYYRDTSKISKKNMIAFLKASTEYELKPEIQNCHAKVRIIVGEKEESKMKRSAEKLHASLSKSQVEIKDNLYHGEYSINHPEIYVKELLEGIE